MYLWLNVFSVMQAVCQWTSERASASDHAAFHEKKNRPDYHESVESRMPGAPAGDDRASAELAD
jgi:hypothetical protein